MGKVKSFVRIAAVAAAVLLLATQSAWCAGFAIVEQSVRGLGTAYAGAGAIAQDPSTIFYNPAGLTHLDGDQMEAGLHWISPQAEFNDKGSTHITGMNLNIRGKDGEKGGEDAFVPNFYYSHSFSDALKAGIGVNAPYGLMTEYDRDWTGRYHGVKSSLKTININPTVAYRFSDTVSAGFGVSIQYAEAELTNSVDFGTIFASSLGTTPQGDDGYAKVEGDDWDYGLNLGVLFEPAETTRIGLSFRSQISHELEGDAKFSYPNEMIAAAAASPGLRLVNCDVTADLTLPAFLELSAYHELNDQWALLASITWTNWKQMEEIRIEFDSGAADSVVTMEWEDTFRYALGAIYTPMPELALRAGVCFDESPVPNAERRSVRVPDGDRIWTSFGVGYMVSPMFEVNLGYAHLFIDDPEVDKDLTEAENMLRGALYGEYDASVDIVSLNVVAKF